LSLNSLPAQRSGAPGMAERIPNETDNFLKNNRRRIPGGKGQSKRRRQ